MIGDKAREMLADHEVKRTLNPRLMASKTEKLAQKEDTPMTNPDLFYTTGLYYLTFRPSTGPNVKKQAKFMIGSDIFHGNRHRVLNFDMIKRMAKEDWRFAFLLKWTDINEDLFEIAFNNISVRIPFRFKVEEYAQMIKEKYDCTEYNIYRKTEDIDLEYARINKIKTVQWENPVKIEV